MTNFHYTPTLGVAIATFNGAKYLGEQLESIRVQTKKVDKIVVYDDGSQDNTLEIAKDFEKIFKSDGIDYKIFSGDNVGYRRNFERAINVLETDLIFLSDQDDVWKPLKVAESVKLFTKNKNLTVLFTDALITDVNLEIRGKISKVMHYPKNAFTYPCNWPTYRNTCVGATMVFKRKFVQSILPIPDSQRSHDAWISRHAAMTSGLAYLPEPMIYYRQHENNTIGAGSLQKSKLRKESELKELKALVIELKGIVSHYGHNPNTTQLKEWRSFLEQRIEILEKTFFFGFFGTLLLRRGYTKHVNGTRSWLKDIIILGDCN